MLIELSVLMMLFVFVCNLLWNDSDDRFLLFVLGLVEWNRMNSDGMIIDSYSGMCVWNNLSVISIM